MGTRFQSFSVLLARYLHENLYKTSKAHKFLLEVTELQLKQKYSVNIYEAEAFDSDIFKIENEEFCYGLMGIAASWLPAIIFWFYACLWNLRSSNLRSLNLRSLNLRSLNLRSVNLRSSNLRSSNRNLGIWHLGILDLEIWDNFSDRRFRFFLILIRNFRIPYSYSLKRYESGLSVVCRLWSQNFQIF